MNFGIFFELSVPRPFTPTNESEVYFNALEQSRLDDELGVDTAWGEPCVEPDYPVVASGGGGDLEIKPVRFADRPEELAFTGTEKAS